MLTCKQLLKIYTKHTPNENVQCMKYRDVMFPAGITQKSVAIPIVEDSVLEATESFFVNVTVPADHAGVVLLSTNAATISITDDDNK